MARLDKSNTTTHFRDSLINVRFIYFGVYHRTNKGWVLAGVPSGWVWETKETQLLLLFLLSVPSYYTNLLGMCVVSSSFPRSLFQSSFQSLFLLPVLSLLSLFQCSFRPWFRSWFRPLFRSFFWSFFWSLFGSFFQSFLTVLVGVPALVLCSSRRSIMVLLLGASGFVLKAGSSWHRIALRGGTGWFYHCGWVRVFARLYTIQLILFVFNYRANEALVSPCIQLGSFKNF